MPSYRPSCLLLDFFGTLVDYASGWHDAGSYLETHSACVALGADLTYAAFIDAWSSAWSVFERESARDNREVAATTVAAYFLADVLSRAPTEPEVEAFDLTWTADWNRGVRYPDHIRDTLAELAAGYRLIVVSNTHGATMVQDHIKAMSVGEHIEHVVTSIDVGWKKPHPAIYAEALRVAGVDPHEALFVGDNPVADYHGPIAVGIPAVLVSRSSYPAVPDGRRIDSVQALPTFLDVLATDHETTGR